MERTSLTRWVARAAIAIHRAAYRATGGRLLGRVAGMPVLLLTTTGRRSGRPRTTPLTYFRDGRDLVVIASNGGSDRPPAWSLNLEHNPRARVRIGSATIAVTAATATPEERARLWPTITAVHPGYAAYQRKTTRRIPVVLLTPERTVARAAPTGVRGRQEVAPERTDAARDRQVP